MMKCDDSEFGARLEPEQRTPPTASRSGPLTSTLLGCPDIGHNPTSSLTFLVLDAGRFKNPPCNPPVSPDISLPGSWLLLFTPSLSGRWRNWLSHLSNIIVGHRRSSVRSRDDSVSVHVVLFFCRDLLITLLLLASGRWHKHIDSFEFRRGNSEDEE